MLALSFKQPWAWLVAAGIKDVDNRTWWLHMPPFLNYPADPRRIYVHASKTSVANMNIPKPLNSWNDLLKTKLKRGRNGNNSGNSLLVILLVPSSAR